MGPVGEAGDAPDERGVTGESLGAAEGGDRLFQAQARALGEATRFRIFRHVIEAGEPVGVAAITAHVGINHNSVRQHLAKLCSAGLLVEDIARSGGPGRPALTYRPAPLTTALSGAPSPYEALAVLLVEILNGGEPEDVGRAAGRRAVAGVRAGADALDVIESEMARQGFRPVRHDSGTTVELVTARCPFEAAAVLNAEVVCGLHRGLTEGMVEALGRDVLHVGLLASDPRTAGCRVQLERVPPG
jgi:predicted ArsR family transcriptional regulator